MYLLLLRNILEYLIETIGPLFEETFICTVYIKALGIYSRREFNNEHVFQDL